MSAEEETGVEGETPELQATAKTAAKKRAGAKKSAAAKESASESKSEAGAETKADAETESDTEPKPATKAQGAEAEAAETKPAAEKKPARAKKPAAAEKPAAAKEPSAKAGDSAAKSDDTPAKAPVASGRTKARSAAGKPPRRRVVRAHARYVRTSARKARMVSGHLPGKSVGEARAILAFTPREVARDWSKLLESAVANAENNHELLEDDLVVREAYADEGPTIKRFRPRAMGRATPIHKRTSHLTITLTPGS
jgi:ribosomal protein L22